MRNRLLLGLASTAILFALAGSAKAQIPVFDSLSNRTTTSIPTATNTFMGQIFNVGSGFPSNLPISSFQVAIVNGTGTNFAASTVFRLNTQFWGAADATVSPVFSNSLGSVAATFTNFAWNTGTFTVLTVNLGSPIVISGNSGTNQGITFNLQADTGSGFTSQNNLSIAIRGGGTNPAPAVGAFAGLTSPNFGYFRNASGRTDFNFDSTDARQVGVNSGLAFSLIAAAPEPGSIALMALGGLGALGVLRRRKSA